MEIPNEEEEFQMEHRSIKEARSHGQEIFYWENINKSNMIGNKETGQNAPPSKAIDRKKMTIK